MDIRIMQYFLTVTREGNISAAAEVLHVTQPALSRQIKSLEEELGVKLFERGSRRIALTEEGMILKKRAEEMVHLLQQTEKEITQAKNNIAGDIYIGSGETAAFHALSQAAGKIKQKYPDIRLHVASGDAMDLMNQLDNGLIDVALIFNEFDRSLYHSLELQEKNHLGILMRKDSPFAIKASITREDLYQMPLIVSRIYEQYAHSSIDSSRLNIAATYNLVYNASLLVEDGIGCAIAFEKLINVTGDSPLCFRPIVPELSVTGTLIWKKYSVFPPAVQLFLDELQKELAL